MDAGTKNTAHRGPPPTTQKRKKIKDKAIGSTCLKFFWKESLVGPCFAPCKCAKHGLTRLQRCW